MLRQDVRASQWTHINGKVAQEMVWTDAQSGIKLENLFLIRLSHRHPFALVICDSHASRLDAIVVASCNVSVDIRREDGTDWTVRIKSRLI